MKPHLFHAEVRRQLARRRAGTHSTKNRAAVSGGGIKPWKQKGTGRARQGTIRAPQWSGGGVVFGPVPRDYEHQLPKKVRRAALRSALSLRLKEGALLVAESLELAEPKTKLATALLAGLGLDGSQSVLVVTDREDPALERALRNLPLGDGAARGRAQHLRRAAPQAPAADARPRSTRCMRGSPTKARAEGAA